MILFVFCRTGCGTRINLLSIRSRKRRMSPAQLCSIFMSPVHLYSILASFFVLASIVGLVSLPLGPYIASAVSLEYTWWGSVRFPWLNKPQHIRLSFFAYLDRSLHISPDYHPNRDKPSVIYLKSWVEREKAALVSFHAILQSIASKTRWIGHANKRMRWTLHVIYFIQVELL